MVEKSFICSFLTVYLFYWVLTRLEFDKKDDEHLVEQGPMGKPRWYEEHFTRLHAFSPGIYRYNDDRDTVNDEYEDETDQGDVFVEKWVNGNRLLSLS